MSNFEKISDFNEKMRREKQTWYEHTIKNLEFLKELEFSKIEISYNKFSSGNGHRCDSIVLIMPPSEQFVIKLQNLLIEFFEEKRLQESEGQND